eukprot:8090396-Pyramimonas_sp.AAC.1
MHCRRRPARATVAALSVHRAAKKKMMGVGTDIVLRTVRIQLTKRDGNAAAKSASKSAECGLS